MVEEDVMESVGSAEQETKIQKQIDERMTKLLGSYPELLNL